MTVQKNSKPVQSVPLPRQPLRDEFLSVLPCVRVGAAMAALGGGGVRSGRYRMHRKVEAVEIVIGAGIDHDARQRAAPAGTVDHLPAGRRRGHVVLISHQDKGW